jgi:hypothetical protein
LVLYGNHASRSWDKLSTRVGQLGPLGILVGGIENMYDLNDLVMNGSEIEKEIIAYYATDPYPEFQLGRSKTMGSSNSTSKKAPDIGNDGLGVKKKPTEEIYYGGDPSKKPGNKDKKTDSDPNLRGTVFDPTVTDLGGKKDDKGSTGTNTNTYNPQPGVNAYNSFNENVTNRKPMNESKYRYQLGFRPFGDLGRDRPIYYHPESKKFTQIKRQRRKNKIYAFD